MFGLVLLLVWLPLPLGSNRYWSIGILVIGAFALLGLCWVNNARSGRSPCMRLSASAWPVLAMLSFTALVAGQLVAGLPDGSSALLGTVDPHQTRVYLLRSALHIGVFGSVLLIANDAKRIRWIVSALIASGFVQALLAIVLFSTKANYQFFWYAIDHGTHTIGTFTNRNHLACYLYLCLSLGIGLLVGSIDEHAAPARRMRDHAINAMKFVMSTRMLLRLTLVVMVVALVLTRSRMGNIAFFSALVVLGALVAVSRPALRKRALLIVLSLALVDIVVVGQWVGLERVVSRIEGTAIERANQGVEQTVEARTEPARQTVPMIAARPWFGYGGGTYYSAFPPFKSAGMNLYFNHAHNDYAEIAADTGLVGLGLLGVVILSTLWRIAHMLSAQQSSLTRGLGYGALMAIVCVLLHSWVDFNLQIPANALTFTAILALAWAAPLRRTSGSATG